MTIFITVMGDIFHIFFFFPIRRLCTISVWTWGEREGGLKWCNIHPQTDTFYVIEYIFSGWKKCGVLWPKSNGFEWRNRKGRRQLTHDYQLGMPTKKNCWLVYERAVIRSLLSFNKLFRIMVGNDVCSFHQYFLDKMATIWMRNFDKWRRLDDISNVVWVILKIYIYYVYVL